LRSGEVKIVTISPVTSAAVAECGYTATAEAREYTVPGLIEALVEGERRKEEGGRRNQVG
jgi:uroporphyrinogen-III synthase